MFFDNVVFAGVLTVSLMVLLYRRRSGMLMHMICTI